MSSLYYKLKVTAITRETSDAVTIHLEHPDRQPIPYKSGQFLTLLLPFEGKKVRRSYSLSSTPHELPRLSITVKRVAGGLVSNYLIDTVQVGQEIEIMEPIGNFCLTCDSNQTRHIVLLGAGSGITPLMSILKSVLHEEPHSKVTLLYGNRDEDAVIFKDDLRRLSSTFPDRLQIEYVYSQPKQQAITKQEEKKGFAAKLLSSLGFSGSGNGSTKTASKRMTSKNIRDVFNRFEISNEPNTLYFLCGPEGFMAEARKALDEMQVPANNIFTERFVQKTHVKSHEDISETSAGSEETQAVTIFYSGSEYQVLVKPDQTILEAALGQNIDLPYSCQAGLCTACMGKCVSGKVKMEDQDGLSDAEIEEGYVLNCVGRPVSDNVIIEI